MSNNFKPIRTRRTMQDQVYDQLRDALVQGAFEAGQGFTIPSLAEQFGTSHMPVREALRRLAAERALQISSTGTATVPPLLIAELRKICTARLILEPATSALAFSKIDNEIKTKLREILKDHKALGTTGDIVGMLGANRAFHFLIYETSQNDVLVGQIENLWLRSGPYFRYLSDKMSDLLRTSYKDGYTRHHEEMLDALDTGDETRFEQAMRDDIEESHTLLFGYLEQDQS